jgi:hypothetical protein
MRKVLATIGTGPMGPVLDIALPTFRLYAERHGYDLVVGTGDADGRAPSWAKVPLLQRLLATYDETLWIDSDILILDPSADIADDVPADAFQGMVEQVVSAEERAISAGVWFLRSGDRSRAFLDAVWNHDAQGEPGMWENLQVLDLLGYTTFRPYWPTRQTDWLEGTALIDPTWNAVGEGAEGRFRHYGAMPNEQRLRLMKRDILTTDSPDNSRLVRRAERIVRDVDHAIYTRTRHRQDVRRYFARRIAGEGEP